MYKHGDKKNDQQCRQHNYNDSCNEFTFFIYKYKTTFKVFECERCFLVLLDEAAFALGGFEVEFDASVKFIIETTLRTANNKPRLLKLIYIDASL